MIFYAICALVYNNVPRVLRKGLLAVTTATDGQRAFRMLDGILFPPPPIADFFHVTTLPNVCIVPNDYYSQNQFSVLFFPAAVFQVVGNRGSRELLIQLILLTVPTNSLVQKRHCNGKLMGYPFPQTGFSKVD